MTKWLPVIILVACFFLFLPNYDKGEVKVFTEMENGCLVYALHMKMILDANERLEPHLWTRIVIIDFGSKLGHAILAFVYKNMTFVYDPAQGSFVVARYPYYDPLGIAEVAYPRGIVKRAAFLEPTLTLHYY